MGNMNVNCRSSSSSSSSSSLRAEGDVAPLGEALSLLLRAQGLVAGAERALALIWAPEGSGEDIQLVRDAEYGVGCVREELGHVVALLREELARG